MAAGVVHIPWYATLFRGDRFAEALQEIAPVALRYGARDYRVLRGRDDMYKFIHLVEFESHAGWDAYWYGPEFTAWKAEYSSWYQVPVLYVWNDTIIQGGLGNGNGEPTSIIGAPTEGDTV